MYDQIIALAERMKQFEAVDHYTMPAVKHAVALSTAHMIELLQDPRTDRYRVDLCSGFVLHGIRVFEERVKQNGR